MLLKVVVVIVSLLSSFALVAALRTAWISSRAGDSFKLYIRAKGKGYRIESGKPICIIVDNNNLRE